MASSSRSQQQRKKMNVGNGRDRISILPDDLLVTILSLLPTKQAIRTSVLSRRWKLMWTLVPSLYFRPAFNYVDDEDTAYMNFIEMFLGIHSSKVKNFYMDCPQKFEKSRLCNGIDAFLKNNTVQHVEIMCRYNAILWLPKILFTYQSLVTLTLHCVNRPLDVPSTIYFPSLKVLDVLLKSPNKTLTEKLFCSAPVLEELSICVEYATSETVYNISSPLLKKLLVSISAVDIEDTGCVINIDAPALENLKVFEHCFGHYILKNSPSLAEVSFKSGCFFRVNPEENKLLFCRHSQENDLITQRLVMLFQSFSTAKDLSLRGRCPMAVFSCTSVSKWLFSDLVGLKLDICDDYKSESFSRWPLFPNLKNLHLNLDKYSSSKNLLDLLALAPNLVSLVLSSGEFLIVHMPSTIYEQMVPSCIRSGLREIEVGRFKGWGIELYMIRYFLKNAQTLEKLTIRLFNADVLHKAEQVKRMPRRSEHCELMFV